MHFLWVQNSFRGIRSSKFRHVFGRGSRKENCYENVLITQKAHDTAACAVNPKFVAIAVEVAGGGAFIVLPLDKVGVLISFICSRAKNVCSFTSCSSSVPVLFCHNASVLKFIRVSRCSI